MEDSGDEDIDDLYADVEKQASSAIGAIQALTELSYETEVATEECNSPELNEGVDCGDGSASTDEKEEGESNGQSNSSESGSESEDDFDIVLNDDVADASNNPDENVNFGSENGMNEDENGGNYGMVNQLRVGRRGGPSNGDHSPIHKDGRSHSAAHSSNVEKSTSIGELFRSSSLVRGEREEGLFTCRSTTRSIFNQNGHDFSGPRSRTIRDINVDAFDHKFWSHPGVDLTDYFNYDLNEDSWKHYYKNLNQKIRSQDRAVAAVAVSVSEKSAKSKQRTVSSDKIFFGRRSKGRFIEVKDGNGERRPSADIKLLVERDSDAIQIPVQDLEESCQILDEVPFDQSSSCLQKPENEIASDDGGDMLCFSGDGEDKPLKLEGRADGTGELLPERCLRNASASDSDPVSLDSDKDGVLMLPDTDERLQLIDSDSDGNPEAISTSEEPKRILEGGCRVKTVNAQNGKKLELSQAKHRHSSASETSKDGDFAGSKEYQNLNSDSEFKGSDKCDRRPWKDSRKSCIRSMSMPGDDKRVTISNVTFHERKSSRMSESENYLYGESDSRMSGGEFYNKKSATFVRDKQRSRLHDRQRSRLHDEKRSRLHDEERSRLRDKERSRLHGKQRSRLHSKQRSRLRPSDYYEGKDIFQDKVREYSSNQGEERLFNCLSGSSYDACPRRRGDRDFDFYRDRHKGSTPSGKPEFLEQIPVLSCELMKRKLHQREKESFVQDIDFLESSRMKGLITERSESFDHPNCVRWKRRAEEPSFDRRTGTLGFLPEHNYSNDFTRGKLRPIPCDGMVADHTNTEYAKHFPYARRDAKSPIRYERKYGSLFNGHEAICWTDYDERRLGYTRDGLSLHPYKEHPVTSQGSGKPVISSRGSGSERHASLKRWHCLEQSRESNTLWNCRDNFDYEKHTRNSDHVDEFASGARCQQSEVLHWTGEEFNSRIPHDCSRAYRMPSSFDRTFKHANSRCDIYDSMRGLSDREKPVNDMGIESINGRGYGLPKEDEKCNQFFHKRNVICRENFEEMLPRCWESSDSLMFVGYRKSSRCSEAGSLKSYDGPELLDWNDDLRKRNFKHINEFHRGRIHENDKLRIHTHQDDAKRGRQFPAAQQSDYLDIEEGEVTAEDLIEKPMENVIAPEGTPKPLNMKNTPADNVVEREMVAAKGYANSRMKELMEKMERRRERFKQPIPVKGEVENAKASANNTSNMEAKLQRPTRKRRWDGS